jgi:hypothetical protein
MERATRQSGLGLAAGVGGSVIPSATPAWRSLGAGRLTVQCSEFSNDRDRRAVAAVAARRPRAHANV